MASPPSSSSPSNAPTALQPFTLALPKLELHAHLNGSIRRSTLAHLASLRSIDPATTRIVTVIPSTLSDAFSIFGVIHACVTRLADVERIAYEMGEDLEEDGVIYAEVRTTPRRLEGSGLDEYVEAVLGGFDRYAEGGGKTVLRLLVSVDRAKHTLAEAEEIVDLALAYRSRVVGIDLSGDPSKNDFSTFVPALERARSAGLKITLHAGEVQNRDQELAHMLDFAPDRFGHCCFVSDENLTRLKQSRVPIELCLTSNLLSNSVPSVEEHHFGLHYTAQQQQEDGEEGAVCCIATDDSGVFGSSLSNEYSLLMENFGLGERETWRLAKRVVEATFEGEDVRQRLRSKFDEFDRAWDWKN